MKLDTAEKTSDLTDMQPVEVDRAIFQDCYFHNDAENSLRIVMFSRESYELEKAVLCLDQIIEVLYYLQKVL